MYFFREKTNDVLERCEVSKQQISIVITASLVYPPQHVWSAIT